MTRRDRIFAAGAAALTLLVPGLLSALAPFAESRATLGTWTGWSVALLMMVPSWVLLSRGMGRTNPHALLRSVMGGALLRLSLTATAVFLFATRVSDPPLRSFLLAFFLGYILLSALELTLATRPGVEGREASA